MNETIEKKSEKTMKKKCRWCDEETYEKGLCKFHYEQEIDNASGLL